MKFWGKIKKIVVHHLDAHTARIFDINAGKLKNIPNEVIWLVYIMCVSVLFQGILDILIKFMGFTPFFPMFPWRLDFLFLTAISVLMGFQALVGMRRRELDVTRNSVQLGLLVESALVISDVVFIINYYPEMKVVFPVRMIFVVLTTANIGILIFLVKRLRLFWDSEGKMRLY